MFIRSKIIFLTLKITGRKSKVKSWINSNFKVKNYILKRPQNENKAWECKTVIFI